jgi:hypothetical protein
VRAADRLRKAARALFAPVDAASLYVVRIAYGLVLVGWSVRMFVSGHIGEDYLALKVHFPFFPSLPILPDAAMVALFIGIAVLGAFIALGFASRICCLLAGVAFLYVFLGNVIVYQNHDYLIWMLGFLFAGMPIHEGASASTALRHAPQRKHVPRWCLWLVRFQLAIPYVFGGFAKVNTAHGDLVVVARRLACRRPAPRCPRHGHDPLVGRSRVRLVDRARALLAPHTRARCDCDDLVPSHQRISLGY